MNLCLYFFLFFFFFFFFFSCIGHGDFLRYHKDYSKLKKKTRNNSKLHPTVNCIQSKQKSTNALFISLADDIT